MRALCQPTTAMMLHHRPRLQSAMMLHMWFGEVSLDGGMPQQGRYLWLCAHLLLSEHLLVCVQELAEARRNRRQPTRINGYGSRTSSPTRELDAVSPIHTPAASPAKPNR